MTDSIIDGINKGIMIGPMTEEEIPFESIKVNGIMVRLKPTGSARIILNLSKGNPYSVNEGMEEDKRFLVTMSSTTKFLRALHSAGIGCYMVKLDWVAAYKNLRVMESDVRLQFFKWCGKYFAELCLVFGAISSVGLYDRLAKVVKHIAIVVSKMDRRRVCQHLDDILAAGTRHEMARFYDTYKSVCEKIGVDLDDGDSPNKAFGPSHEGMALGIMYDTQSFTWWLREDKLGYIIEALTGLIEDPDQTVLFMKSITGKIIDVRLMVPHGKFKCQSTD